MKKIKFKNHITLEGLLTFLLLAAWFIHDLIVGVTRG